jgi:putative DNA primase/helicase
MDAHITQGRWPFILSSLGLDQSTLTGKHTACPDPGCSARHDGFRFTDQGAGRWYCSGKGSEHHGDGFDLLQMVRGWDYARTAQEIEQLLGIGGEAANQAAEPLYDNARDLTDWSNATDEVSGHPYIIAKGISGKRVRVLDQALLVPMFKGGQFYCLQRIYPPSEGKNKWFPKGAKTKGCYLNFHDDVAQVAVVTEGYADGCSIHDCTSLNVFVAFSASNIPVICSKIREHFPEKKIIVAADNDPAGLKYADQSDCDMIVAPDEAGQDFNQVHQMKGVDGVQWYFEEALQAVDCAFDFNRGRLC